MTDEVLLKGSCHCKKVTFTVLHSPNLKLNECNCSICYAKGRNIRKLPHILTQLICPRIPRFRHPRHISKIALRQRASHRIHLQYRHSKALVLQDLRDFAVDGAEELSGGV